MNDSAPWQPGDRVELVPERRWDREMVSDHGTTFLVPAHRAGGDVRSVDHGGAVIDGGVECGTFVIDASERRYYRVVERAADVTHVRLTVDIPRVGPAGCVVEVIEGDPVTRVRVPSSAPGGSSSIPASAYEPVVQGRDEEPDEITNAVVRQEEGDDRPGAEPTPNDADFCICGHTRRSHRVGRISNDFDTSCSLPANECACPNFDTAMTPADPPAPVEAPPTDDEGSPLCVLDEHPCSEPACRDGCQYAPPVEAEKPSHVRLTADSGAHKAGEVFEVKEWAHGAPFVDCGCPNMPLGWRLFNGPVRVWEPAPAPVPSETVNGAELIAAERARQQRDIDDDGGEYWTPEHDAEHKGAELVVAAMAYANQSLAGDGSEPPPDYWPWHETDWKPSPDPIRNLVKAGALIAAEIDRRSALGQDTEAGT